MKYLFAGGGTGGHLMPGIAMAQRIRDLPSAGASITFAVSDRLHDADTLARYDLPRVVWGARRWTDWIDLPAFAMANTVAVSRTVARVRALKPDVVVALGGYASAFPAIAAVLLRRPLVLLEQNVIPGRANRRLSRYASLICCQWEQSARWFSNRPALAVTGNPVRPEILQNGPANASQFNGLANAAPTVLVMGGSQGAHAINQVIIEALPRLGASVPNAQFIHLAGAADRDEVEAAYRQAGARAFVADYLDDMACAYRCADLVVSRAGGTSLAEITALGLASILIPYPYAADDHQRHNARVLGECGAAEVVDPNQLTPDIIAAKIETLLRDDTIRRGMSMRAREKGRPDAADRIVESIEQLLGRPGAVTQPAGLELKAGA